MGQAKSSDSGSAEFSTRRTALEERMDQEKIKEKLRARDETALKHIQNQYGNLIKQVAFNLFRSDTVAEECLNDTLMDIWNTIPPADPKSIMSYACMIVRRRAIDRIRKENTIKRFCPEGSGYTEVEEDLEYLDDVATTVTDKMVLTEIINGFVKKQSRLNREIFISRYHDFESLDSIAARLHMTKNSVNIRLTKMKRSLKAELEKGGVAL